MTASAVTRRLAWSWDALLAAACAAARHRLRPRTALGARLHEVIDEGLAARRRSPLRSRLRLGRVAQLGDVPTFIDRARHASSSARWPRAVCAVGRPRCAGDRARPRRDSARRSGSRRATVVTEFLGSYAGVLWRVRRRRAVPSSRARDGRRDRSGASTTRSTGWSSSASSPYFDARDGRARRAGTRDPLTGAAEPPGVLGRARARDRARRARYDRRASTLVFVDLDRFKAINDTLGHVEGDRVLHRIAPLAPPMLRGSDARRPHGRRRVRGAAARDRPATPATRFRRAGFEPSGAATLVAAHASSRRRLRPRAPGAAHYPSRGDCDADALAAALADARQYEVEARASAA